MCDENDEESLQQDKISYTLFSRVHGPKPLIDKVGIHGVGFTQASEHDNEGG